MRNIRKTMTVKTVVCTMYDRVEKVEKEAIYTIPEFQTVPELPANCVPIETKVTGTKEVVYIMSPDDFVKYAKVELSKVEPEAADK